MPTQILVLLSWAIWVGIWAILVGIWAISVGIWVIDYLGRHLRHLSRNFGPFQ